MTEPILFYPAFGSPYSYIAAQLIDEVGQKRNRPVLWRPVRLSTILKRPGATPTPIPPEKLAYWRHDAARVCRLRGLPFARPEGVDPPFDCDELYNVCYALADGNEAQLRTITLAALSVIWAQGQALKDIDAIVAGMRRFNLSSALVTRYANSANGQAQHRATIEAATATGMMGAPWIAVGDEAFWGHDRIPYLDQWLSVGRGKGGTGRPQPVLVRPNDT
ncbi:MAG: DsbA family protein [Alphaproteobacteria bacterium]